MIHFIRIIFISAAAGVSLVAAAQIINRPAQLISAVTEPVISSTENVSQPENEFNSGYSPDDWDKFILSPRYNSESDRAHIADDEVNMLSYGSMNVNLTYGNSFFTDKKYKQFDEDKPVSRVISKGFVPEQLLLLHMEGTVGKRLTVFIDHDSRKKDNQYLIQYRAVNDDEVIREINAGEIDIKFDHSKYAVFENSTSKGMGIDALFKKDNLSVKTFGSIARGDLEIEIFKGNSSPGMVRLSEFQYAKKTWYQIEPYKRYDGLNNPPAAGDNPYATLRVFNSNDPSFIPRNVNINPSGFELYMDDQNPYNNNGAVILSTVDGGSYTRLQNGTDYTINYSTGLIKFLRGITESARIFAVYSLSSGTSSDPAVRSDLFPGRNFVFIKYGSSIHEDSNYDFIYDAGEDKNNDGRLNIDVYEVRSFYNCGEKNISPDSFRVSFLKENSVMSSAEIASAGRWNMDFTGGTLQFELREPFKQSIDAAKRRFIYSEIQAKNAYDYSRYSVKIDYNRETGTFQLKRMNIIPGSVRIMVNRRVIPESFYSIDYTSGFLSFNDANNPVITSETDIEVKYEYLPFEGQTGNFSGGLRTDYAVNKDINAGGSILYSGSSGGIYIPQAGSEPVDTVMVEGDIAMKFSSQRLSSGWNRLAGTRGYRVPAELKISGELAKSWKNINSFGKALLDNMESAEEIISLSTSEKDWVLSSNPSGSFSRSILNYMFYRDPSDPEILKGLSYNAKSILYSVKPGPYNVAFGHIPDSIEKRSSQRSLVLDFDGAGEYASVVTRRFTSGSSVDMSGLQYAEISYYYTGSGSAEIFFDLGSINEDSDSDGILDTEDLNRNGYLDGGPGSSSSEDRGYVFNESGHPSTRVGAGPGLNSMTAGDGVLNTEDLNGNGYLDTAESYFTIPSSHTSPAAGTVIPEGRWRKLRIYLNQTSDRETLRSVESIRFYVKKSPGTSGKLFVDDIRFVTAKWKEPEYNGIAADPDQLKLTMVNTLNDSDYKRDSFMSANSSLYKNLYGEKSDYDLEIETESALQVEYGAGSAGDNYSIIRRFPKPVDLRHYGKMNLWLNYRQFAAGDRVTLRLASSDSDYYEYGWQMDYPDSWREIILSLNKKGNGSALKPLSSSGSPDMKRIISVKIIITSSGSAGKFWLNELYVSSPEILEDTAHWYETEITIEKPLYVTKSGVPVLSDMNIKYIKRGHGRDFSSIAKKDIEMSEDIHELSSTMKILPNWGAALNYTAELSESDALDYNIVENRRGKASRNIFTASTDYIAQKNPIPTIRAVYKYDSQSITGNRLFGDLPVLVSSGREVHSPAFEFTHIFEEFISGKGTLKYSLDMTLTDETVARSSDEADNDVLSLITKPEENKMIQKSSSKAGFLYEHPLFYLHPEIQLSSEETVRAEGAELSESGISGGINGKYHFPFFYGENFKFMERTKGISFKSGARGKKLLSPEYGFRFISNENRFKDITSSIADGYERVRDSKYHAGSTINIPVNLSVYDMFKSVKSFSFGYARNIYFNETSVPYEGEETGSFDENFGIKRVFNGLAGSAFDLFRYYPGIFFTGRGNFSEGRDTGNRIFNTALKVDNNSTFGDYNNNIRVTENFSVNSMHEYKLFTLYGGGSLYQAVDRQNIYGVPVQLVSLNANGSLNFDLMKMFNFWFFRPNTPGNPHHSSYIETGYSYTENMMITSNIEENVHAPSIGLMFKWDRSLLAFKAKVDFRFRNDRVYIPYEYDDRAREDDIYINNIAEYYRFHENDTGYNFSVLYETDVKWLYKYFSDFYELAGTPVFSAEYSMNINRYDYLASISPEPYDLYMLIMKLTLDLHKNIQGGISSRLALEQFRDRIDNGIKSEVFSIETGFHFSLIF
jgi:hypothetical protein